jgi:hypothetical protein
MDHWPENIAPNVATIISNISEVQSIIEDVFK